MVTGAGFPCPACPRSFLPRVQEPRRWPKPPPTPTLADTVTISLAEPIRRGEQVIAAIDLTKPKAAPCAGWRCKT
jgi:hypothetical protein